MLYSLKENVKDGKLVNVEIISPFAGVVCAIPMPHALSLTIYAVTQEKTNGPKGLDGFLFGYSQGIIAMGLIQAGYVDNES